MDSIQAKKSVLGRETPDIESRIATFFFLLNHTFRESLTSRMAFCNLIDKTKLENEEVVLLDHHDQEALQFDADLSNILKQIDSW